MTATPEERAREIAEAITDAFGGTWDTKARARQKIEAIVLPAISAAVDAEREACAQVAETAFVIGGDPNTVRAYIATAIRDRARKGKP